MATTQANRRTISWLLTSLALAVILGSVLVPIFRNSTDKKETVVSAMFRGGDTPVILIGGSMTFKSGRQASPLLPWTPMTAATDYYINPGYKIVAIAVKAKAPKDKDDKPRTDDQNRNTDKSPPVDVSQFTSWEIDAYTSASTSPVVKVSQNSNNEVHVTLVDQDTTARLCPNASNIRIDYGHNAGCPDSAISGGVIFAKIVLNPTGGQSQTLSCIDDKKKTTGWCRIVLIGPS